ncbi:hypothetical protein NDU88_002133 [Pleurodeles waltl]|uniref:Uncharacterized protein n=1 Tax=Pleurodeles waltl TaxID=8319 RepID=A0AAV7MNQ7_PLEWA|nr:hypothetical protein NDU88_002133 [Pleurodeles waltl]
MGLRPQVCLLSLLLAPARPLPPREGGSPAPRCSSGVSLKFQPRAEEEGGVGGPGPRSVGGGGDTTPDCLSHVRSPWPQSSSRQWAGPPASRPRAPIPTLEPGGCAPISQRADLPPKPCPRRKGGGGNSGPTKRRGPRPVPGPAPSSQDPLQALPEGAAHPTGHPEHGAQLTCSVCPEGGGAKEPRLSPGPPVCDPRPGPHPGDQEGGGKKRGGGKIRHPRRHRPSPQRAAGAAPGHTDLRPKSQAPPSIRGEQSQPHVSPRSAASAVFRHFGARPSPVPRLTKFGPKSPLT